MITVKGTGQITDFGKRTAGQWWISLLVAFAIIAIIITVIIVSKFTLMMRLK